MCRHLLTGAAVVTGLVFATTADGQPPSPDAAEKKAPGEQASIEKAKPGWVDSYLAEDLLAGHDTVSLDDLNQALQDPMQRDRVIGRHFHRVTGATSEQKHDFLVSALQHESLAVRRQAAEELAAAGHLESVVVDQLSEFLGSGSPALKEAVIVALEQMAFDSSQMPPEYWDELVRALASKDERIRSAAGMQLEIIGPGAVPALLEALKNPEAEVALEAAKRLSQIVGSRRSLSPDVSRVAPTLRPGEVISDSAAVASPPKAGMDEGTDHSARMEDGQPPTTVRVYYGTNREMAKEQAPNRANLLFYPCLLVFLVISLFGMRRHPEESLTRAGCRPVLRNVLLIAFGVWAAVRLHTELTEKYRLGTGPQFAFRRDMTEKVHYGFCDVSIPPTHISGKIESPLIGPEDENRHVVLRTTALLEEEAFFETVRSEIAKRDPDHRSCFIFIHGYNVSFENAAKRTAQIHFDLKFSGTPIFFSWPSRSSIRHYFSDRNEIGFSQYVIQQFLLDVAQRVDSGRIHVIAHSMGADATCRAIAELGDRGKIFDQIILAAPDIDREVFRLQLAPRLTRTASRTTMYCSRNDFALQVSNTFNDALRAGDSSRGILTMRGVDTVDASGIDTDLLGHSYYGDCLQIIDDVKSLMISDLPPDRRQLIPWPVSDEFRYWTFAKSDSRSGAKEPTAEKSGEPSPLHRSTPTNGL